MPFVRACDARSEARPTAYIRLFAHNLAGLVFYQLYELLLVSCKLAIPLIGAFSAFQFLMYISEMLVNNRKSKNENNSSIARMQQTSNSQQLIKLIEDLTKPSSQIYGQKVSCTRLNIVGMTSLCIFHAMTNSKGSRLCTVDGWIANRYVGSSSGMLRTGTVKIAHAHFAHTF